MHANVRRLPHDGVAERFAAQARPPAGGRAAEHDLGHVFAPGDAQDLGGEIGGHDAQGIGAEPFGETQRCVDAGAFAGFQLVVVVADVNRGPGRVESVCEAARGAHQLFRTGVRPDADEQALGGRPRAFDDVLAQEVDHLVVDPVGRAAQRQFAQGGQRRRLEEAVDGARAHSPAHRPCHP